MPRISTAHNTNNTSSNGTHSTSTHAQPTHNDPFADEFNTVHTTITPSTTKSHKPAAAASRSHKPPVRTSNIPFVKVEPDVKPDVKSTQSTTLSADDYAFLNGGHQHHHQPAANTQLRTSQSPVNTEQLNITLYGAYERLGASSATRERRACLADITDLITSSNEQFAHTIDDNTLQFIDTDAREDDTGVTWPMLIGKVVDHVVSSESLSGKTVNTDAWSHLLTLLQYSDGTKSSLPGIHTIEPAVDSIVSVCIKGINNADKHASLANVCSEILKVVLSVDSYAQSIDYKTYQLLFNAYSLPFVNDSLTQQLGNTITVLGLIMLQYTHDVGAFLSKRVLPFYSKFIEQSDPAKSQHTVKLLGALNAVLDRHAMSILPAYRPFISNVLYKLYEAYPSQPAGKNEYIHMLYTACRINSTLPMYSKLDILHDTNYMKHVYRALTNELKADVLYMHADTYNATSLQLDEYAYRLLYSAAHILPAFDTNDQTAHADSNGHQSKRVKVERMTLTNVIHAASQPFTTPWLQLVYVLITTNPTYVTSTNDILTAIRSKLLTTLAVEDNALRCWSLACLDTLVDLSDQSEHTHTADWFAVIQHVCNKLLPTYSSSHLSRSNKAVRDNGLLLLAKLSDKHLVSAAEVHTWKSAVKYATLRRVDISPTADTLTPIKKERDSISIVDHRAITPVPLTQAAPSTPSSSRVSESNASINVGTTTLLTPHDHASINYLASYYTRLYESGRTVDSGVDTITLLHALLSDPSVTKANLPYTTTAQVARAIQAVSALSLHTVDQHVHVSTPFHRKPVNPAHAFHVIAVQQQLQQGQYTLLDTVSSAATPVATRCLNYDAYDSNMQTVIASLQHVYAEQQRQLESAGDQRISVARGVSTAALHYAYITMSLFSTDTKLQRYTDRLIELAAMFMDMYAQSVTTATVTADVATMIAILRKASTHQLLQRSHSCSLSFAAVLECTLSCTLQLVQRSHSRTNGAANGQLHNKAEHFNDLLTVLYMLQSYQIQLNAEQSYQLLRYVDSRIRLKKVTSDWSYVLPLSAVVVTDRSLHKESDVAAILCKHTQYAGRAASSGTIQHKQLVQTMTMCYLQHIAACMRDGNIELSTHDLPKLHGITQPIYHALTEDNFGHMTDINRLLRLHSMHAGAAAQLCKTDELVDRISASSSDWSYGVRMQLAQMLPGIATSCDVDTLLAALQASDNGDDVAMTKQPIFSDRIIDNESMLYTHVLAQHYLMQTAQSAERQVLYTWMDLWNQHESTRPVIRALLAAITERTVFDAGSCRCEMVYRNFDTLLLQWIHAGRTVKQFPRYMLTPAATNDNASCSTPYGEFVKQYADKIVPIVVLLSRDTELQSLSKHTERTTADLIHSSFEKCFAYFYALYAQPPEKQNVWSAAANQAMQLMYKHYTSDKFSATFSDRQPNIVCALIDLVADNMSNHLIISYTIEQLNKSLQQLASSEQLEKDYDWLCKSNDRLLTILIHIRWRHDTETRPEAKQLYSGMFNEFVGKCIASGKHIQAAFCRTIVNTYLSWLATAVASQACESLLTFVQTVLQTYYRVNTTDAVPAIELGRMLRHVINRVVEYSTSIRDQRSVPALVSSLRSILQTAKADMRVELELVDELPSSSVYDSLRQSLHSSQLIDDLIPEVERFIRTCASYGNQTLVSPSALRRLHSALQQHSQQLNALLTSKVVHHDNTDTSSQLSQDSTISSQYSYIEQESDEVIHTSQNIRQHQTCMQDDVDGYQLITRLLSELLLVYDQYGTTSEQAELASLCLGTIQAVDPYLVSTDNNRLFLPPHMYIPGSQAETRQIVARLKYQQFITMRHVEHVLINKDDDAYVNKPYHVSILLLLDQLLQSSDATVVHTAHTVLVQLFSTNSAKTDCINATHKLDSTSQLYFYPFKQISTPYTIRSDVASAIPDDDSAVWSTDGKTYDQWAQQLFRYLTQNYYDDQVLHACSSVPTQCDNTLFAVTLLPYLVYSSLVKQHDVLTKVLIDRINQAFASGSTYAVPVMLSVIHFIHQQQLAIMREPLSFSKDEISRAHTAKSAYTLIPKPRALQSVYNYIATRVMPHLAWFDVVHAADTAGYTASALLYYEQYMMPQIAKMKLDSDQEQQLQNLQTTLYSHIDDADAIYAVSNNQLVSGVELAKHNKQWSTLLQTYDTMLQSQHDDHTSQYQLGVAASLHQLGCYDTMLSLKSSAANTNTQLTELRFDAAWRSLQFEDVKLLSESATQAGELFNASMYSSLRQFNIAVDTACAHAGIANAVKQGRRSVSEALQQLQPENSRLVFDSVIKLQMLNHVSAAHDIVVADNPSMLIERTNDHELAHSSDGLSKLLTTSRQRLLLLSDSFDLIEPVVAVHSALLRVVNEPTALSSHYLFASTLARESDYHSHASSYMRQANLLAAETTPLQNLAIQYENAKNQWAGGNTYMAVSSLERIVGMLTGQSTIADASAAKLQIDILCRLSDWTVSSHASASDTVEKYLHTATELTRKINTDERTRRNQQHKVHYHIAKFNDRLFESLHARTSTYEYKKQQQRNIQTKAACDRLAATVETPAVREILANNKKHADFSMLNSKFQYLTRLQKELTLDQQQQQVFEKQLRTTLHQAIDNYIQCLMYGDKFDTIALHRLVSLWFTHYATQPADAQHMKAKQSTMRNVQDIPSYKFIPLVYQIASRLGPIDRRDNNDNTHLLNTTVYELYRRLLVQHPYHSMYQLYALSAANKTNRVMGRIDGAHESNEGRIKMAQHLINEQQGNENRLITSSFNRLTKAYIAIGDKHYEKGIKALATKDTHLSAMTDAERHILPAATRSLVVRPDGDYFLSRSRNTVIVDTNKIPVMQSFAPQITFANSGVNRPLIAEVTCSDGEIAKQLIKPSDDLRQDGVMEQVFKLCNELLSHDGNASKRHLYMRTYNVVPLTPGVGLVEWVTGTQSLNEILTHQGHGVHPRYGMHRDLWQHPQCLEHMYNAAPADKQAAYAEVMQRFPPQMRHHFVERYVSAVEWLNKRTAYTRSVAVSSIIGYIVGLGDRHMQNILMDCNTSEVVHIDLGVAFEAGKILKTPELVPFRLTRDMVDGFGVDGTQGRFKRCCEQALRVLRQNYQQILTVLDVLVHDPLYKWSLSTHKVQQLRPQDQELNRQLNQYIDAVDLTTNNNDMPPPQSRRGTQRGTETQNNAVDDVRRAADAAENAAEMSPLVDPGESGNAAAQRALAQVRSKLGVGSSSDAANTEFGSLSVEGQVQYLINEATDKHKLAVMYHGWAPWA